MYTIYTCIGSYMQIQSPVARVLNEDPELYSVPIIVKPINKTKNILLLTGSFNIITYKYTCIHTIMYIYVILM